VLLRILFEDLSATTCQYLDDISLVESFLNHVPDRVEPQAIPPEPSQRSNALQESRLGWLRPNAECGMAGRAERREPRSRLVNLSTGGLVYTESREARKIPGTPYVISGTLLATLISPVCLQQKPGRR
jgi:hypothetical protein